LLLLPDMRTPSQIETTSEYHVQHNAHQNVRNILHIP
jgi:hypothetical protein